MKKALFAIAFLMLGTSAANAACSSQRLAHLQASKSAAIAESAKIEKQIAEGKVEDEQKARMLAASYQMLAINIQQDITSCYLPGY
jgi:hypothetical protein